MHPSFVGSTPRHSGDDHVSSTQAHPGKNALLSAIWNYARDKDYTSLANPCSGIKGNKETGRDTYVEDELFKRVYDKADPGLQDAMDLAYLTGQRDIDTRMMDERDVRDGQVWVLQGKTKAKRRGPLSKLRPGNKQGLASAFARKPLI